MISEELEFSLSQYVDGTLPPDERLAVEQVLAREPAAQAYIAEERALVAKLRQIAGPPLNVDWQKFAARVSAQVAEASLPDDESARRLKPPASHLWWRPVVAIAASVLVLLGLAALLLRDLRPTQSVLIAEVNEPAVRPVAPVMIVAVDGDGINPMQINASDVMVSVGPPPESGNSYAFYAPGTAVVSRPSRVAIASGFALPRQGAGSPF